jgi:uncharacterized membrane protein (DUF373 family)
VSRLARPVRAIYTWFERALALALVAMLMVVLTWACVIFIGTIGSEIWGVWTGADARIDLEPLLSRMDLLREVFGGFLLLLIGLELMKTVVMYLDEDILHWEVVFPVALIAVARHSLEIDPDHTPPMAMVGIGAVIVSLAGGYFLLRRSTPQEAGATPPRP